MEAKDFIKEIRKFGLNQQEIAEMSGLNQPAISKIERGDVSDVRAKTYRALQSLYKKLKREAKRSPSLTEPQQEV